MKFSLWTKFFSSMMIRNNVLQESVMSLPIGDIESQSKCKARSKRGLFKYLSFNVGVAVIVGTLLALLEFDVIPPRSSGFYCRDPKLSFKYNGDTVDGTLLAISVFLLPLITIFITEYIFLRSGTYKEKSLESLKITMFIFRGFLLGIILNFICVEAMKLIKRDPRPTFFDICNPDAARNCTEGQYVTEFVCKPDPRFLAWFQHDATLSFPSGHTSLSVFCALFTIWYLQKRAFSWGSDYVTAVPLLQGLYILYAVTCSITRITDHRHHWWDVLTGCVVGMITVFYTIVVLCDNFQILEKYRKKASPLPHLHCEDVRTEQISL